MATAIVSSAKTPAAGVFSRWWITTARRIENKEQKIRMATKAVIKSVAAY
jgi:hypothetical protein